MRRVVALSMVVALVAASASAGIAAATVAESPGVPETAAAEDAAGTATSNGTADQSDGGEGNESSAGLSPGAQLAGVIAVQRAEIDGELATRSFEMEVTAQEENESKARVVARHVDQSQQRLDELRSRVAELRAERRAGNLSQGRYRAQVAHLAAEIRSLQRLLDQTRDVAVDLPDETRRENDIGEERFRRLRNDTENLSGSEVSEIAREVAGRNVGNGLAAGRRTERGPPGRDGTGVPGNATPPGLSGARNGTGIPNAANETRRDNTSELPGNAPSAPGREGATNRSEEARNRTRGPGASADAPGLTDGDGTGSATVTAGQSYGTDVDASGDSGDAPGRASDAPPAWGREEGTETATAAETEEATATDTETEDATTADAETETRTTTGEDDADGATTDAERTDTTAGTAT